VRGVAVEPAAATAAGDPGAQISYVLTVTNTGAASDSYTVAVTSTFSAQFAPANINNLPNGASTTVAVTVTIPVDALAADVNVADVVISAQGAPGVSAAAALTTTVNQVAGVDALVAVDPLSSSPSSVVTYTVTVTNTGNGDDDFTIAVGNADGWAITTLPPASTGTLMAQDALLVSVEVTIPAVTPPFTSTSAITLTSVLNTAVFVTRTFTTLVP
jgi:uncharacterized membrane protein